MQDLYSRLVCPAIFFAAEDAVNVGAVREQEITPTENEDGKLAFDFDLLG